MAVIRVEEPLQGFKFIVNIPQIGDMAFSKISGLEVETEVVNYREGTDPLTQRKIPGMAIYPVVTMERGLASDRRLEDWFQEVTNMVQTPGAEAPAGRKSFQDLRKIITITLYSRQGQKKREWKLKDAWPSKLTIGDLDAASSEVVIQTLELQHEGILLNFPV